MLCLLQVSSSLATKLVASCRMPCDAAQHVGPCRVQMCTLLEPNMQPDCQGNIEQISTSSCQLSGVQQILL